MRSTEINIKTDIQRHTINCLKFRTSHILSLDEITSAVTACDYITHKSMQLGTILLQQYCFTKIWTSTV